MDLGCETQASIDSENADGDLFFCAPEPGQLTAVFNQASKAILIQFSQKTTWLGHRPDARITFLPEHLRRPKDSPVRPPNRIGAILPHRAPVSR